MRIRFLFLIQLLILSLSARAELSVSRYDSIFAIARTILADTTRSAFLIEQAENLYNIDLKSGYKLGQAGLQLALEADYRPGVKRAQNILKRISRRLGNHEMAIQYSLAGLRQAELEGDSLGIVEGYTTLGNVYTTMGNHTEAQYNLERAYAIGKRHNVSNLGAIANFLGRNYAYLQDYTNAKKYIEEALASERAQPHDDYTLSYILNNLAEVHLMMGDHRTSIELYDSSLSLPENRKSPLGKSFSYIGLAKNHNKLGRSNVAIEYLNKSLTLSKSFALRAQTQRALEVLTEVYESRGEYQSALNTYRQFHIYGDSLLSDERIKTIENLRIFYDTERLRAETEILIKEAEFVKRKQLNIIVGGLVTLLALLLLVAGFYYTNVQRRKSNRVLQNFNEELKNKVAERTATLSKANADLLKQNHQLQQFSFIASHNLRSPVARILGLLNILELSKGDLSDRSNELDMLMKSGTELDETIKDMNNIIDIRIGKQENKEWVNLGDMLAKSVRQFEKQLNELNAQVIIEDVVKEPIYNQKAYLESVFDNLLSNAIKYRNPKVTLEINVSLSLMNDILHISVSDNGMGIELDQFRQKLFTPYQRFHLDVEGKGIGLYMVKSQIEAMDGRIEVHSEPRKGTTFSIFIPVVSESNGLPS